MSEHLNCDMSRLERRCSMRRFGRWLIGWTWNPRYWSSRGWGPWNLSKSYAGIFGPLFVEHFFTEDCAKKYRWYYFDSIR